MAKHQHLLHILKHKEIETLIDRARADAITTFPNNKDNFTLLYLGNNPIRYIIRQLNHFNQTMEFLDIKTLNIKLLSDPQNNQTKDQFNDNLNSILKSINRSEIKERLNKITDQECALLDEALTNFRNDCFLSATLLALKAKHDTSEFKSPPTKESTQNLLKSTFTLLIK